jgi:hypothetical protein
VIEWVGYSDGMNELSYRFHSGCESTVGLLMATQPIMTSGISESSLLSMQKPIFTNIRSKL